MNDENTKTFRRDSNNPQLDRSKLDSSRNEEKHAPAQADADAQAAKEEQLTRGQLTGVKQLRRRLGLTQEEFAARFQLPYATVRDWEQGVREPDAAARNFLRVIAYDPDAVMKALEVV